MWNFFIPLLAIIPFAHGQCNGIQYPCNNAQSSVPTDIRATSNLQLHSIFSVRSNNQPNRNLPNSAGRATSSLAQPPQDSFNSKLFQKLKENTQHKNLIYSPVSMEILLSFLYCISNGRLMEELRQLLNLPNTINKSQVSNFYQSVVESSLNPNSSLKIANKLFYNKEQYPTPDTGIDQNLRILSSQAFAMELESLDFAQAQKSSNVINSWAAERTNNLIQNVISPGAIKAQSQALLVNTLYFKNNWTIPFASIDTQKQQFHSDIGITYPVDMMYIEDVFLYGEFESLGCTALELPYVKEEFKMLLLLPSTKDGLQNLERKLTERIIQQISQNLKREEVTVKLPKFEIDYEADMVKSLKELGLQSLFNEDAKLQLFKNQKLPLIVDQIQHKAKITVNEAGTEAAASTFVKFVPLSLPARMKYFIADHPFLFVIYNPKAIYFIGHVMEA